MGDIETLAIGWDALKKLHQHGDEQGIPSLTPGACRPCMNFAAALLRGSDATDVLYMRCPDAQEWHRQVQEADLVAEYINNH